MEGSPGGFFRIEENVDVGVDADVEVDVEDTDLREGVGDDGTLPTIAERGRSLTAASSARPRAKANSFADLGKSGRKPNTQEIY